MSDWGAWAIGMAGAGLLAAGWLWRRAEGRVDRLVRERERLESQRREIEARLDRSEKARKRQAEALSSFRRKGDKARKRDSRPASLPMGTAARVQDLETALSRSEQGRRQAEAECERLARERVRLEALLAECSMPPAEGAAAVLGAPAPPAPATPAPSPSAPSPEPAEETAVDPEARLEAERTTGRERIAELEAALASRARDAARMKKRIANQEQLYAAVRAELALKKDRLRAQEEQIERLQALQVALVD